MFLSDAARLALPPVDFVLSATAPLSDGADWFARLANNTEGLLKVILKPCNPSI